MTTVNLARVNSFVFSSLFLGRLSNLGHKYLWYINARIIRKLLMLLRGICPDDVGLLGPRDCVRAFDITFFAYFREAEWK